MEDVGGFRTIERNLATADGPVARVPVAGMSASGFQLARVAPLLGRFLLAEDELAAAPPVAVIGYDAWQSTFAAEPDVVGQTVQLDGVTYTIVGVMPEGFPTFYQLLPRIPEVAPVADNREDAGAPPVRLAIHARPARAPEII